MPIHGMPDTRELRVVSTSTYVVYEKRSGAIVHVHESYTFEGAAEPRDDGPARAILMAGQLGHRVERLEAVNVESFDERVWQRVDPKTRRLVAQAVGPRRAASTAAPRKTKRPAKGKPGGRRSR